jgi:multicomponent Na+:H+ antiporter subunit B
MTKYSTLIMVSGLAFLLMVITGHLPLGNNPMLVGNAILETAKQQTGAANIVTSVVLAFRGLDTLGELAILFAAASVVGLVLTKSGVNSPSINEAKKASSFIALNAVDLIFPLMLIVGLYIITHGHLTPGGGFQGGVILAIAFVMPIMVRPSQKGIDHFMLALIESFAGVSFIVIGLIALFSSDNFLQPFLHHGQFRSLWSAGTLPLLYLAVGLKVGAELAGLLLALNSDEVNS